MKVNDFRIGNLLQTQDGDLLAVTELALEKDQIGLFVLDRSKFPLPDGWKAGPINLTELWLEKLGFKNVGLSGNVFEHKKQIGIDSRFVVEVAGYEFFAQINFEVCQFGELKYVHQLQNLYYAITGHELIPEP